MPTAIGVHCFPDRGAINCNGVYIESRDGHSADYAEHLFTFKGSRSTSASQQLVDLFDKVDYELADRPVDVVVVRTADFHRNKKRSSGASDLRSNAEGVVLMAVRRRGIETVAMRGVDVGKTYGADKKHAEERAKELLPDGDPEACAAAIAGVRHFSDR